MKKCSKCHQYKNISEFHKHNRKKDGLQNSCKECMKLIKKEWYENNIQEQREKGRINSEKYRVCNLEKLRESSKNYYYSNRDKMIEYSTNYQKIYKEKKNLNRKNHHKKKYVSDDLYKLKFLIRKSIRRALKNNFLVKKSKTVDIIGCSFPELKLYFESKFEPWMNWGNHGLYNGDFNFGWDIDHIIPISMAKSEDDVLNLNHYTNLQPLCSKINRDIKNNRI